MRILSFISSNLLILIASGFILVAFSFKSSYTNFTKEEPIAILKFTKIKDKEFLANIYLKNKTFNLVTYGDQWRLDAQFKKWKYYATALGFESKYVLDRFEGRYKDIEDQNENKKLSYNLYEKTMIDYVTFGKEEKYNYLVDTTYGNSIFKDISENKIYKVYKNNSSLIVRETKIEDSQSTVSAVETIKKSFFSF